MTSASSLAFPGSRTLAQWRRLLAPHDPQAWWVGYLFVHHVEALAEVRLTRPLEPLLGLALEAVALELRGDAAVSVDDLPRRLDSRLNLGAAAAQRLVQSLTNLGLCRAGADGTWMLTPQGQKAAHEGCVAARTKRRQVFSFVERLDAAGKRLAPPHFLRMHAGQGVSWVPDAAEMFQADWLQASLAQAPAVKEQVGFPPEVDSVFAPPAAAGEAEAWDRIVIDRLERVLAALLVTPGRLLGFAARVEGWDLNAAEPILNAPAAVQSLIPELAPAPTLESWRVSWSAWCQTRALPAVEAEACRLSFQGEHLRIETPPRLMHRLESGKSDILKGDAWLLAGEGHVRAAARIEVVPWR